MVDSEPDIPPLDGLELERDAGVRFVGALVLGLVVSVALFWTPLVLLLLYVFGVLAI